MQFSNTTNSFYPSDKTLLEKYSDIPEDLIEISEEDYLRFLNNEYGNNVQLSDGKLETRTIEIPLTQEQIESKSKSNRVLAIDADILFSEVYYQVSDDCADIKSALTEASILGLEDSYTQNWRLSDNTWRTTTIAEAKEIVALYVARKQKVWAQYETWTSGNKTSVFEYTEE